MLRLSTKARYATRIMLYMASKEGQGILRKKEIAESENISQDYAEQIFIRLKRGGLVHSHRGSKGGFTLARKIQNISVADVLYSIEGPINMAPCEAENCSRAGKCTTRFLWQKAEKLLNNLFSTTTLKDITEQAHSDPPLFFNI